MNRKISKNVINFWTVVNGKIEENKYRQQRRYPGSYESAYNNFLYLKGNLKYHSNKKIFEISLRACDNFEKKILRLLLNRDFKQINSIIDNNISMESEIILEFDILKYLNENLSTEEIEEIKKTYGVFTYFHGEYEVVGNISVCRLIEVGCRTLAILSLIYQTKKVCILEDLSEYIKFRTQIITNNPSEFCDTRKNIELSYEYFRVIFSEEINKWSLDGYSPNIVEDLFYYYYGIEFKKSEDRICFRSEDNKRLNSNSRYYENAVDSDDDYGIGDIIAKILGYTRDAVNNYEESYKFKSYSKALCTPLFKYFGRNNNPNPSLVIKKLRTNSVSINVEYHIFYWFEDIDGNRYTISYLSDSPLDIETLLNKELFLKELYQNVDVPSIYIVEEETGDFSYLLDIDNVSVQLCNFTLDISNLNRDSLDRYFKLSPKFKRLASFKKDKEVISTEPIYLEDKIIDKQETIVFIRLLYLTKIFNVEINSNSLGALLNNKFEELIKFTEKEIVILSYINEYINFNIGYERRVFNEIEDLKSIKSDGILAILEFTIKFSNVDRELPKKLVKLLIEKND